MKAQVEANKKTKKKIISRKKKFLLGILLILMIGIAYEQIGEYFDNREYKPVGQLINVNGHNMHIFAKGRGNITVVFTSGWRTPCPYVDYYPLHNEISNHTRIVVYDRPGYGWSDIANTPRDFDTITKELHELLEKSKEKPPYILVGHSFGANEVLRFAQMYKNEVKGIVLIDGSNPEYTYTLKRPSQYGPTYGTWMNSIVNHSINVMNKTGISRFLCKIPNFYSSKIFTFRNKLSLIPDDLKKLDEAMLLKNLNNKNHIEELRKDASVIVSNGYIKDIPLRIITSEEYSSYELSNGIQRDLKKWSNDSKQIIVKGSRHYIHMYHPEVINNEILDILKK